MASISAGELGAARRVVGRASRGEKTRGLLFQAGLLVAVGLGATKRQVALRVVFPAAISGIVAGVVLGASRAVGETVVILVAGGQLASLDVDPREPHQNMAAFIADVSRSDVSNTSAEFQTIFAVGTTLFLMTLILNFISIRFVRKYRQVYE